MRPIWKGALTFGLVNIPVGLYSATTRSDLSFRLLHAKDQAPIAYRRVCTEENVMHALEASLKARPARGATAPSRRGATAGRREAASRRTSTRRRAS